jgi:LysM repeat protein
MIKDDLIDSFAKLLDKKDSGQLAQAALDPFLSRVKTTYEIKSGDNLWEIAKRNKVPLNHLLELNPELRGKENKLKINQKVKIPYSPMDLAQQMQGRSLDELIKEMASAYGIDEAAFRQSLMEESKLDPKAINPKTKATGLGQLMPEVVQMYGVTDATDAAQSAAAAAAHLRSYIYEAKKISPDGPDDLILWNALMMYNWGIGNFLRWYRSGKKDAPPKEARVYPAKVFYGLNKTPPQEYLAFYNEFVRDMAARV